MYDTLVLKGKIHIYITNTESQRRFKKKDGKQEEEKGGGGGVLSTYLTVRVHTFSPV